MNKHVTYCRLHDIYKNKVSVLEHNSRASKPNMNYFFFRSKCRKDHRNSRTSHYVRLKEKEVTEIRYYLHMQTGYCVCPACNCTFEREYQAYCDRCGQKLAWNLFNQNKVTLIKRIPCTVRKQEALDQEKNKTEAIVL